MHYTERRYPRTLAQAFASERFSAVEGPYQRHTFGRALMRFSAWLAAIFFFAGLLAWRL